MGKLARMKSPIDFYHVYNRGIDKKDIFDTPQNRHFMLKCVRESISRHDVEVYAYCIMHNHMHFLLLGDLTEIGKFMQEIQGRYGYTFNLYQTRQGHVFQNSYKSKAVFDTNYYWGLIRYIHLNPVKAGYTQDLVHYPFCSLYEYLHQPSASPIIPQKAMESILTHYQSMQNFLKFHQMNDRILYDDIEEDMDRQASELDKEALAYIQELFPVQSWIEAGRDDRYVSRVVNILLKEFYFSQQKICLLLALSPYKVRTMKDKNS